MNPIPVLSISEEILPDVQNSCSLADH